MEIMGTGKSLEGFPLGAPCSRTKTFCLSQTPCWVAAAHITAVTGRADPRPELVQLCEALQM